MMRPASSFSPRPRAMEQSGAPPIPKRFAKAFKILMMGKVTPKPVSANVPTSGMRPI